MSTKPNIRVATQADAAPIAAIYAPIVETTAISFEIEPPGEADMARRILAVQQTWPWLVSVGAGNEVTGYAYATSFRARAAYRWCCESTAYVAETERGQGIGRRLYDALFAILRRQGFLSVIGVITLPNDASVGLHEAMGFEPVGVYRKAGYKFGAWHDVGWWTLELGPADIEPSEPVAFPDLQS
ncbi:MAG: N-acetyltransferase family protein [Hyphomonadaceae bacterium]|nr:N-acetyltransferase family protein [Hyphomonadaceae bacterium]